MENKGFQVGSMKKRFLLFQTKALNCVLSLKVTFDKNVSIYDIKKTQLWDGMYTCDVHCVQ